MKEFIRYILMFEKARYYYGGALRNPVRITQKFWDEMAERKKYYSEQHNDFFRGVDTTLGSSTADLGERPKVPDWIVELRSNIFIGQGIIGWCIIIGYLFSKLIK